MSTHHHRLQDCSHDSYLTVQVETRHWLTLIQTPLASHDLTLQNTHIDSQSRFRNWIVQFFNVESVSFSGPIPHLCSKFNKAAESQKLWRKSSVQNTRRGLPSDWDLRPSLVLRMGKGWWNWHGCGWDWMELGLIRCWALQELVYKLSSDNMMWCGIAIGMQLVSPTHLGVWLVFWKWPKKTQPFWTESISHVLGTLSNADVSFNSELFAEGRRLRCNNWTWPMFYVVLNRLALPSSQHEVPGFSFVAGSSSSCRVGSKQEVTWQPEPPNKGDAVEGGSCSRRSWKPEPSTPIGMVTNPTPINPQLEMLVCFPCVTMDYLWWNHYHQPSHPSVLKWICQPQGHQFVTISGSSAIWGSSGWCGWSTNQPFQPSLSTEVMAVVYSHSGASPDKFKRVTHLRCKIQTGACDLTVRLCSYLPIS